jgi:dihydroorotase
MRSNVRGSNNEDTQVVTDRMLMPLFCLHDGVRFDADAPSLPLARPADHFTRTQ